MPDQPTDTDNPNIDIPEIGPYAWTVNALVKEISNRSETHDFKISGFFGPWGSGKTTLLREVVDKVNGDERRNAHVEIFDAWEARDDDNLPLSIIAHLIEPDHKKIWTNNIPKKALDYVTTALSTMSRLIGGPGIADVAKDKKVAKEITFSAKDNLLIQHAETRKNRALLEEVLTELESTILVTGKRKPASRLVVAVDNLDRCSPSKMVDVLESLHNFKGLTKVRFLLVGDEVAFVEGIRSRYPTLSQEGARAYLEKIVSPVIRMPSLKDDPVGLMKILKAMGLEECATEASNSAGHDITVDLNLLFDYCRFAFDGNPRKALHMFRSLPSHVGRWNYDRVQANAIGAGGAGIVLHWILSEHAPQFLRLISKCLARFKSHTPYVDLKTEAETFRPNAHLFTDLIVKDLGKSGKPIVTAAIPELAINAMIVCRSQCPRDSNQPTWEKMINRIIRL